MAHRTGAFVAAVTWAAMAATAEAALLTVGPAGSQATIQAAIGSALANAEDDEIRVQSGTYAENLSLTMSDRSLLLSGGWDSTFVRQSGESVVDAGRRGRALALTVSGGDLLLRSMAFTHGVDPALGGGIRASISGGAVTIERCTIRDNTVGGRDRNGKGGGISVELTGSGKLRLTGSEISGNRAEELLTYGAGIHLLSFGTSEGASFRLDGNRILGNVGHSTEVIDPRCATDPLHCEGWLGAH